MNQECTIKLLLIEDNEFDAELISSLLTRAKSVSIETKHATRLKAAIELLRTDSFDVIISDLNLPDSTGIEAFLRVHDMYPDIPVIVLTGLDDETTALSAVSKGAQDYLVKDQINTNVLVRSIRYAVERQRIEEALQKAHNELEKRVLERTAELTAMNEELEAEIAIRKETERRIAAGNMLLQLLKTASSGKAYLDEVVALIRQWSGCRCAGIRMMDKEGRIPYESYQGFNDEFRQSENCLSICSDQCICIRVFSEKPEIAEIPAMTSFGSFRSDNFLNFLEGVSENERSKYRSGCVRQKFASVAVIPIRYGGKVIASVHMADEREGRIKRKFVEFFEEITPLIGEAIHKLNAEAERARLIGAIESAADAIAITDPDWSVRYVNPSFSKMTLYSSDEVLGRNIGFLAQDLQERRSFFDSVEGRLRAQENWSGQFTNRKKDGTLYEESAVISAVRGVEGDILNFVIVSRDITEILRLESIAQAVNTMNNIGYIFSGIRHEIGNPINSIKMTLGILRRNFDKYDREKILDYIDRSLDESSRIEYLLKSLRNFNMYERPELQEMHLRSFMENFYELIRGDFSLKRGIEMTLSYDPDIRLCIADPRALHQILLNICSNAADACEGRESPRIEMGLSRRNGMVCLSIADNGIGMTEEQQKDLFKPFHTTKKQGTGLGLVIVKKMLASMNSMIEVQSSHGKGTVVLIRIPEKEKQ